MRVFGSSDRRPAARRISSRPIRDRAIGRGCSSRHKATAEPCSFVRREAGDWWLTIDRWDTLRDFEAFQDDFGVQYRGLDKELEGVAGEEMFVGAFEED